MQIAAPMTTPDSEPASHRSQARVLDPSPMRLRRCWKPRPKRFVSGETLPYLGRNVRMIVDTADIRSPKVRFDHWRFRVTVPHGLDDSERYERIRRSVVKWYRDRAAARLSDIVERWWPRLGRGEKSQILVRDQRQRWGSCAPDGTLRFNWRTMMLEQALIEYVVVHELAHLTHQNHSTDFWGLVAKAMPDAQQRRRHLRGGGADASPVTASGLLFQLLNATLQSEVALPLLGRTRL